MSQKSVYFLLSTTALSTYSIYLESVCPLVRIGILPLRLPQESVSPPEPKGVNTRWWGVPNSYDWRKSQTLCLLCAFTVLWAVGDIPTITVVVPFQRYTAVYVHVFVHVHELVHYIFLEQPILLFYICTVYLPCVPWHIFWKLDLRASFESKKWKKNIL
jgi:hypothetical protein